VSWKKVGQEFAILGQFSKNLPKENNRKTGENSPNLVTLLVTPFLLIE
jgi:hypothetical protein